MIETDYTAHSFRNELVMKRKEIEQMQEAGLISAEQAAAIAEYFHLNGGSRWNWLMLSMCSLAGALILGGIIMLISANWGSIPDVVKMVVAMAMLLGFWVTWWRLREVKPLVAEVFGLLGGGMWLGSIALYGQIFQLQNPFVEGCMLFFLGVCAIPFLVRQRMLVVVVVVASAVLLGALLENTESWLSLHPWVHRDSEVVGIVLLFCLIWWLLSEHWRVSAGFCRSYAWMGVVAIVHFLFIVQIALLYQPIRLDSGVPLCILLLAVPLLMLRKPAGIAWKHWVLMMVLLSLPYPIGVMLAGAEGGKFLGGYVRVCHGWRADVSGLPGEADFLAELWLAHGAAGWYCAHCQCAEVAVGFRCGADYCRSADAGVGVAAGKAAPRAGEIHQGTGVTFNFK